MYMVQITETGRLDASCRYSGVGKTMEAAMRELVEHFHPRDLALTHQTVRVFKRDPNTLTFKHIPKEEMDVAVQSLARIYGQIMSA